MTTPEDELAAALLDREARISELERAVEVAVGNARAARREEQRMRDAALALASAPTVTSVLARRLAPRTGGRDVPFFDPEWYVVSHPEVARSRLGPLLHYRRHGRRMGWSPHPLFDVGWYRHHATTVRPDDDLVEHYLDEGAAAGFDPHPLFDSDWYAARHDLGGANPLAHYLDAWRDGASPHPLFDGPWYRRRHPEIGGEPLQHFLQRGAAAGNDPHPLFDLRWYLSHSPDVAESGMNPLVHYTLHGWREGRDPHRLVEVAWYRRQYGVDVDPLRHYLDEGAAAGHDPGGIFETAWYVEQHPESAAGGRNPLEFFVEVGLARGDLPSRWAAGLREPQPRSRPYTPAPLPPSPFGAWGQTSVAVEQGRHRTRR